MEKGWARQGKGVGRQLSACPYMVYPLCGIAFAQIAGMGASIDEGITLPMIFDFKGLESDSKILLIK